MVVLEEHHQPIPQLQSMCNQICFSVDTFTFLYDDDDDDDDDNDADDNNDADGDYDVTGDDDNENEDRMLNSTISKFKISNDQHPSQF